MSSGNIVEIIGAVVDVEFPRETVPKVYDALKQAITAMDIYEGSEEPRLDERQLSEQLGVSRTPVREALFRLEQEGFVRIVPRRGVFVARKTKLEILEMITVWAALESMAARLITEHASDEEISSLRALFATMENDTARANIDCSAEDVREAIMSGIHALVGDAPQFDDMTLVVISRDKTLDG